MSNNARSTLGTIFILVIAFCGIFLVNRKTRGLGWMDLTEGDLYTLTNGTKAILAKVDQPLTIKLFYALEAANRSGHDLLLDYNNHYYYVRDLLRAYERQAGGKLKVMELDPRPYSDAEDEADNLQIQRIPISEREGFYFGLAVLSETGGRQKVPFLDPREQELLEYKISEAIDLAGRTKKTKLGVLSSVPVTGGGMSDYMRQMMAMQGRQAEQPWVISEHLRRQYDIVDVPADGDTIPADVDFLMVIHPKDLPEKTLYAVDQFVVKGGKAMFFVDPHCMLGDRQQQQNMFGGQPPAKQSSSLEKLLNAWGVSVEEGKFAGDLAYAKRMQAGGPEAIRAVPVMDFRDAAFNGQEVTTKGLKMVTMVFAGAIRKKDGADVEVVPLITTTQEGNTWTAQSWELGGPMGPNMQGLSDKFEKGVEKLWTAARVTGKFKSAFEDKPKAEGANGEKTEDKPPEEKKPEEAQPAEHVKEAAAPSTIFVVADVDMLTDPAAYQRTFIGMTPMNSNVDFVFNCLEQLAGSADLIDIRSRPTFRRPLTVVDEIEREADLRTRDQVARINAEIQKFESELQTMNSQATETNVALLQSEAIEKQRKLEAEIRAKRREVRDLQEGKLAAVESVGAWWKTFTRILVPLVVLAVGIALAVRRHNIRKVTVLGGAS